ncbi:MAG: signal peptide peptidase SppA [Flavobacteriales bacterium]
MKQFFKFMFASFFGTFFSMIVAGLLLIVIFIAMLTGAISSAGKADKQISKVEKNSILHITLNIPIKDRTSENPFENFDFNTLENSSNLGLDKILASIEKAKSDDRIEGIYLDLTFVNTGMASIEEIRNALLDFKKSKKWIISYSEVYTQGTYYLASVADKIYVNPAGILELKGLATQLMFFKNMLAKLDVDVQIIRHGKFKSAVEPFMLEKMSASNREQLEKILNTAWGSMINGIAASRDIKTATINELADGLKIQDAKDALKYNFVDGLMYKDELLAELRNKLNLKENADITTISLGKYANAKLKGKKVKSKNKIAVIYAAGNIVSGKGSKDQMGSETISKAIREARLDDDVKAIVLRVNSGGGSALASDVMWRETTLAKKAKPFIVSMGDVAASGGYYIACAADKIVASEKTITGSIGVFGVIPNMEGFFNNKMGITFDGAKTNDHADMMSLFKPLTVEEKDIIQIGVEKIYDDFITKVAAGRGMTKAEIDAIGQGRVWIGNDALEIGLVDEIGGLNRAIDIAQEMAKLENFELENYPKRKDPVEQFIEELSGNLETRFMKAKLGDNYKYYQKMESVTKNTGVMARIPFDIEVH